MCEIFTQIGKVLEKKLVINIYFSITIEGQILLENPRVVHNKVVKIVHRKVVYFN